MKKLLITLSILGLLDFISARMYGLPDEGVFVGYIFLINPYLGGIVHMILVLWPIWGIAAFFYKPKRLNEGKQKTNVKKYK